MVGVARRVPWQVVVCLLALGWFVVWQYRATMTPVLSLVGDTFGGATDAQLGLISSSCFFGNLLMQLPSGLLVDRFGRRAVLVPGLVVFALGACVVGLASSLPMLYAGSFLAGLGSGTYYGIAYSLTAQLAPERHRGVATALVSSGVALGSGVGMVASSRLAGTGVLPWQALIGVSAVCALALALAFRAVLADERPKAPEPACVAQREADEPLDVVEVASCDGGATGAKRPVRGIARFFAPRMVATYLVYFATCYLYYIIDTWLPSLLQAERGFDAGIVGSISSLVYFAAIPGSIVVGRVADALPRRRLAFIVGLELAALVFVVVMLAATNEALLVAMIVAYGLLGKLTVEPLIIAWFGRMAPAGSLATTLSVLNLFAAAASVAAPAVTGLVSDAFGSKAVGLGVACVVLAVATLVFAMVSRRARANGQAPYTSR